tara:strand:- start:289 stop:474 length:186 start_codon:yes stop_codon:yes gene_type:complete
MPLFFEKITRNPPAVVNLSGYPLKGTSETFLPIFSTDERGSLTAAPPVKPPIDVPNSSMFR